MRGRLDSRPGYIYLLWNHARSTQPRFNSAMQCTYVTLLMYVIVDICHCWSLRVSSISNWVCDRWRALEGLCYEESSDGSCSLLCSAKAFSCVSKTKTWLRILCCRHSTNLASTLERRLHRSTWQRRHRLARLSGVDTELSTCLQWFRTNLILLRSCITLFHRYVISPAGCIFAIMNYVNLSIEWHGYWSKGPKCKLAIIGLVCWIDCHANMTTVRRLLLGDVCRA